MEKLSEYIPLIIILATFIFSMIGKVKKQGRVTQETTLPGTAAGDFMDEEEFMPTINPSNQRVIEKKAKKFSPNKPETVRKKGFIPSAPPEILSLEMEEERENSLISFDEEEDMMKAIIYTEIINRKEY
jgi:hypothetical protein